ncbi:MAG: hypothetical protein ACM3Q0_02675 [Bacteroidota bacterium]
MYLLDTNVCIALLNGRPEQVRVRSEQVRATDVSVGISFGRCVRTVVRRGKKYAQ